jgi:uncharacterized protein YijF (DUF1287 family)
MQRRCSTARMALPFERPCYARVSAPDNGVHGRMGLMRLSLALLLGTSTFLHSGGATGQPRDGGLEATLVAAAHAQHGVTLHYDGRYARLDYPAGDVPQDRGVCTDVVIRAYRALGIDLQQRVHEDMRAHFDAYPKLWGLARADRNIDHRRVPNLQRYFSRHGQSLPVKQDAAAFRAGDLVTWRLPGNLPHIGIVSDRRVGTRPLIVHNVGAGVQVEDVLFAWPVTGHYRYFPEEHTP